MNILSAYSAYARPASLYTEATVSPAKTQPVEPLQLKAVDDAAIEFLPARVDINAAQQAAHNQPRTQQLPTPLQAFVTTQHQDGNSRIGRFLDIHA